MVVDVMDEERYSHRSTTSRSLSLSQHTNSEASLRHRKPSRATTRLNRALQDAKTMGDPPLPHMPSQPIFATARTAAHDSSTQIDRSVSRYRSDANLVAFADDANARFCYTPDLMPGVHFYTFLASRDAGASSPTNPARRASTDQGETQLDDEERPPLPQPRVSKPSTGLRMWLPDTIVYGETGRAVWLYSDEHGVVQRMTNFTEKTILQRFGKVGAKDNEPIAVSKEPIVACSGSTFASNGNLLRLLTTADLKTLLNDVSSTSRAKSLALQQFVACNGSKAFIVRSVFEIGKPPYAWMISNKTPMHEPASVAPPSSTATNTEVSIRDATSTVMTAAAAMPAAATAAPTPTSPKNTASTTAPPVPVARVCTSVQVDKSCTFIKLNERGCATVAELNQRIVKYIEMRLRLRLQVFVSDFTKDANGRWWLLQIKAFRVMSMSSSPASSSSSLSFTLPLKLRQIYLNYRQASVLEESNEVDERGCQGLLVGGQMTTPRRVQKLLQCKCCLAAYPKIELSFKMTPKMIKDTLIRIRLRLPPEKTFSFLNAALSRDLSEPSLAYEAWSVCSFCYAIYERDQQLQRAETRFATLLGTPSERTEEAGLSHIQNRVIVDCNSEDPVLPAQLTLCRLMLVINGIYDIPPELYEAEQGVQSRANPNASIQSRLFLRIAALGYTECIPIHPGDIVESKFRAPRGVGFRRWSRKSTASVDDDDSSVIDGSDTTAPAPAASGERNYWIPLNLIRTLHFFAPRTPLHAKLKDTSGITPFLNEENSILIQFVRANAPPLQDPMEGIDAERIRSRRAAIAPTTSATSEYRSASSNHSILLGATKIRLAQFRSAYVTKLDFFACMALRGEMFNIKGNVGLERMRYVDSRLLTAQYQLRHYNGVFVPDFSFVSCDALPSEWMDCLTVTPVVHAKSTAVPQSGDEGRRLIKTGTEMNNSLSAASLLSDNEEMDEELEQMIDRVNTLQSAPSETQECRAAELVEASVRAKLLPSKPPLAVQRKSSSGTVASRDATAAPSSSAQPKQLAVAKPAPIVTPVVNPPVVRTHSKQDTPGSPHKLGLVAQSTNAQVPRDAVINPALTKNLLWYSVLQIGHANRLESREHLFCRWECRYQLFGQTRVAVERTQDLPPSSAISDLPVPDEKDSVQFNSTHKFFLAGQAAMMHAHIRANTKTVLHLRNDMFASASSTSGDEYCCAMDLSPLLHSTRFDVTLDIRPESEATEQTPRKTAKVTATAPFLSLSMQLSPLPIDPDKAIASGDFVVVGCTDEGLQVLKKIA